MLPNDTNYIRQTKENQIFKLFMNNLFELILKEWGNLVISFVQLKTLLSTAQFNIQIS